MKRLSFLPVLLVVVLGLIYSSLYRVNEWEQVVITQFGRPVGEPITEAGLHVKLPFIQDVIRYEKRILRWDGDPKEIPTRDKRYIWVDATARWRIVDALKFLQVIREYDQAYAKLDDIIDSVVRDYVSSNDLVELVRTSDMEGMVVDETSPFEKEAAKKVELGREAITRAILAEASKPMSEFGMQLVDVRIKRINYTEEVRQKVYERMISERKRKAAQFRSEGEGKKAEVLGQMEKELKSITSEAYKTSEEIRGKADAESTKIYGKAYSKDPEFYSFYKTMETYRSAELKNSVIILGTDSEFYKFLKEIP